MKPIMQLDLAFLSVLVVNILDIVVAKRDPVLYCGACLSMVDDMNWWVSQTDPKKKVQVGSFRINPDGKQDLRQIPLARSEVHLIELLENTCNDMQFYVSSVDEKGHTNYFRKQSRDGQDISLDNTKDDKEMIKRLKFACEAVIEDHEDEIIQLYKDKNDNMEQTVCVDMAGYCKQNNVTEKMLAYGQAIMAGMPPGFFGAPPTYGGDDDSDGDVADEDDEAEDKAGDDGDAGDVDWSDWEEDTDTYSATQHFADLDDDEEDRDEL